MWLELHHIRWYSHGGETLPLNLITLCSGCHASVHEGRLKICGNLKDGLLFTGARGNFALNSVPDGTKSISALPTCLQAIRFGKARTNRLQDCLVYRDVRKIVPGVRRKPEISSCLDRVATKWYHGRMAKKSLVKTLQKRGNSYALVFDRVLMEQLGIDPETPLQITVTGGSLVVRPVCSGAGPERVSESLAKIRNQPGYPEMLSNLAQ